MSFLRRSLKSSESQDGEKKKKGGFLNLIKRSSKSDKSDKLDKSEKIQATLTSSGPSPSAQPSVIPEEPSSPKVAIKSPAPEPKSRWRWRLKQNYIYIYIFFIFLCNHSQLFWQHFRLHHRDASSRSQPTDYSSSSDRSEELRTPDSMDEPWEGSDGRGSPQGGKRYPGVQMMGSGLLAEMKAKHERRAYKVKWCQLNQKIKKLHKVHENGAQQYVWWLCFKDEDKDLRQIQKDLNSAVLSHIYKLNLVSKKSLS